MIAPPSNGRLAVIHLESWPAGGRMLTLRSLDPQGQPTSAAPGSVEVRDVAGQTALDSRVAPVALRPGFTALLIRPAATATRRAALVTALEAFFAERPADERIGLYRWGTRVLQVGNFTSSRVRLGGLAQRFLAWQPDETFEATGNAVREVSADLQGLSETALLAMRAVVVLAVDDSVSLPTGPITALPVLNATAASEATVVQTLRDAGTTIDLVAATGHYQLAVCGSTNAQTVELSNDSFATSLTMELPESLPEQISGTCTAASLAIAEREYPPSLDLVFTAEQRAVYDARIAANSTQDFSLSLRIGTDAPAVAATAHLRGKGSLACARRNYTVNLDGAAKRHLMPDSATDEFYLISMCADDKYVQQYTGNLISRPLDLFPLQFRYIEVLLDGQTRGVYLLLEKTREELVSDNSRVRSVMRRRFNPPTDSFELKWESATNPGAVATLEALFASLEMSQGSALVSALGARFDVDLYYRLAALHTLLGNGDWVDEAWFVSTDSLALNGTVVDWYQPMAWDADDLFAGCHYSGTYAVSDPNLLVYCAESRLDHKLFTDPELYDQYVGVLETLLLDEVTPARFADALATTRAAITPFMARAEITAAMTELLQSNPDAADPQEAQRLVDGELARLQTRFDERHALLLARIATYREQTGK